MPKSSQAELNKLREACFARDGYTCCWPGCPPPDGEYGNPLQMAHLVHRGMGGSKERNVLSNVVSLCRYHHMIYDGKDGSSNTKRELAVMLRTVAGI